MLFFFLSDQLFNLNITEAADNMKNSAFVAMSQIEMKVKSDLKLI